MSSRPLWSQTLVSFHCWIKALGCQDEADRHDQVPAWDTKWAFLASFMRSWGNSPFLGPSLAFYAGSLLLQKTSILQKVCSYSGDIYTALSPHRDWVRRFWPPVLPCHCGVTRHVINISWKSGIGEHLQCLQNLPRWKLLSCQQLSGCAATLHFGKCSQPSIKPTGTPHPCHVGNLIPLHQRLTSRAPPSDTGPTSPIIKPTLVQPTPIVTPCPSVAQFDVIFHTDMVVWRR